MLFQHTANINLDPSFFRCKKQLPSGKLNQLHFKNNEIQFSTESTLHCYLHNHMKMKDQPNFHVYL